MLLHRILFTCGRFVATSTNCRTGEFRRESKKTCKTTELADKGCKPDAEQATYRAATLTSVSTRSATG